MTWYHIAATKKEEKKKKGGKEGCLGKIICFQWGHPLQQLGGYSVKEESAKGGAGFEYPLDIPSKDCRSQIITNDFSQSANDHLVIKRIKLKRRLKF